MPRRAADMSSVAPDILLPSTPPDARGGDHGAPALAAAILPGAHSYSSISEKISGIELTARTARWWVIAFAACSVLTLVWFGAIGYLFYNGVGIWGLNVPDLHFGGAASDAPAVGRLDQSLCRGHDGLRPGDRRHVSDHPPGPALVLLLADALSQRDGPVAPVAQPAGLGLFRDFGLLAAFADVLVSGTDPGLCHLARSGARARRTNYLRPAGAGLARRGAPVATAQKRAAAARRTGRAPGGFRA